MFNKIEINYPEFWLKLEREFTSWTNLIDEPNWYWKSTILNTLLSLYSKKYPWLRTLPTGVAKINTPDKIYMLSKGIWVWLDEAPNPLIKYILPWEFFNLSTPEQRSTLVKLLDIDFEWYMKENIKDWTPTLEKELNAKLKENKWKEDIILDDIIRFKSIVTMFEKDPITLEDTSDNIESVYALNLRKHNDNRFAIQNENNAVVSSNNRINSQIQSLKDKQQELRNKYTKLTSWTCPTCLQKINVSKEQLDEINSEGKSLWKQIEDLESQINNDKPKEIPEVWPERTLAEKAKFLKLKLIVPSTENIDKVNNYNSAKQELSIKEKILKDLWEIKDKDTLVFIKKYKNLFTKNLESKVKELWLEIELFKTQANWEIVESFVIMLDWKAYSELSWGNKLLCQIRLSLAFVKKLWLDFILIDEAWLVSQKNFDLIESECKWLQIIMARATPFVMPIKTIKTTKSK